VYGGSGQQCKLTFTGQQTDSSGQCQGQACLRPVGALRVRAEPVSAVFGEPSRAIALLELVINANCRSNVKYGSLLQANSRNVRLCHVTCSLVTVLFYFAFIPTVKTVPVDSYDVALTRRVYLKIVDRMPLGVQLQQRQLQQRQQAAAS
jgi:hypothetical protein